MLSALLGSFSTSPIRGQSTSLTSITTDPRLPSQITRWIPFSQVKDSVLPDVGKKKKKAKKASKVFFTLEWCRVH